jgi:hypothetical protein
MTPTVMAPSATTPLRPVAGTGPQVEKYEETEYVCKDTDTFQSISSEKYLSADYAEALKLWNQHHYQTSGRLHQEGTLKPGDHIFLPPAFMLEKRYGSHIPRLTPIPTTVAPDGPAAVPVGFTTPAAPAVPAAPLYYKVQGNDERLLAIARQTLNDSNRWTEIARLNPTVNPEQPLPVGTLLLLPPGARVPSENVPATVVAP